MEQSKMTRASAKLAVKNKAPNPIQITAEQLLREAVDRQQDEARPTRQRVVDEEELLEYRVRRRKEFEDGLRRQQHNLGLWIRYAEWEAGQREFRRARSVFERALNVEFHNIGTWMKYIDMEMKNKFINSARNLFDRVVQLLPRLDQFWIKYTHMEELLGNYAGARAVFERWMEWEPEDPAWMLYVRFEVRCGELGLARGVFERYLSCRPSQRSFLKFAKFEEEQRDALRARAGYEKAIEVLPESHLDETFYIRFAQFEERQKEFERAKCIYEQALLRLPQGESEELYRRFVSLQKQRGDRAALKKTVITKRRLFYEQQIEVEPKNYDLWFDLLKLEEANGDIDRIRDVYERSVAQIPPIQEKLHWKRYIYLWINYAICEETIAKDTARCRAVWDKIIEIIPHAKFSFSKVWIYYAEFEIRQLELGRARKILGRALGQFPHAKIFKAYANLELRLGHVDRCRTIYAKYIETFPESAEAWIQFIEFEVLAQEYDRARFLAELALSFAASILYPELIWKAYIDFEIDLGNLDNVTALYERLLDQVKHYKVFKSYASFQLENVGSIQKAREVVKRGLQYFKENRMNEHRKLLIDHWIALEQQNCSDQSEIDAVIAMKPKIVRIRRAIIGEDETAQGVEEVIQYIFKDDEDQGLSLKILEKAKAWKKSQAALKQASQSVPVC